MNQSTKRKLVYELSEQIRVKKVIERALELHRKERVIDESIAQDKNEYITNNEKIEIIECYKFIIRNEIACIEELNEILKSRPIKFRFLIKVFKQEPSLFDELIDHGPSYVEQRIANIRRAKQIKKEMNK